MVELDDHAAPLIHCWYRTHRVALDLPLVGWVRVRLVVQQLAKMAAAHICRLILDLIVTLLFCLFASPFLRGTGVQRCNQLCLHLLQVLLLFVK